MSEHSGEIVERVFAVAGTTDTEVHLFGFGLYVGDRRRPGTVPFADLPEPEQEMYRKVIREADERPLNVDAFYEAEVVAGRMTRTEADDALLRGHERHAAELARPLDVRATDLYERCALNPLIVLDDGQEVWGCECWWGPIERWEQTVGDRSVVEVSIVEKRAAANVEPGRNLAITSVVSGGSGDQ